MAANLEEDSASCDAGLWGWSPPRLPADTAFTRGVDRFLPRTGPGAVLFYGAVIAVLLVAPHLPTRGELAADGMAALAAGAWCVLNFWRCRHAHCVVSGLGWLALSGFSFAEAGIGHSLVAGYEQPIFLGVLVVALAFEGVWYLARGTNAVTAAPPSSD